MHFLDSISKAVGIRVKPECPDEKLYSRLNILKLIHAPGKHKKKKNDSNGIMVYSCDICGKQFSKKSSLKCHVESIHRDPDIGAPACDICGKTFSFKNYLKLHINSIHRGEKFNCGVCGNLFTQRSSLGVHVAAFHQIPNSIAPTCDICFKSFRSKHYLKLHLETVHKGIKSHVCVVCQKSFSQKSSLKTHSSIAHVHQTRDCNAFEKKAHKCDICGKAYSQLFRLRKHITEDHILPVIKGDVCNICGKSFSHKRYLKVHITKVHKPAAEVRIKVKTEPPI